MSIYFTLASQNFTTDKSYIFIQDSSIHVYSPKSIEELKSYVETARKNNKKIIIQGKNHSANGSSLGSSDELILRTQNFNKIEINKDKVIVGSGVVVEELDKYLKQNGFELITKNEGGNGPTIGGFISAGGIGKSNNVGFWETVLNVSFIDGYGKIVTLTPKDKNFKWIFGSMGQFGVIYEVELRIIKKQNSDKNNEFDSSTSYLFRNNYFYWFPFFMEIKKKDTLRTFVSHLIQNFQSDTDLVNVKYFFNYDGINIMYKNFNPPLVFNFNKDFTVMGLKIFIDKSDSNFIYKINKIRMKIDSFILKNSIKSYFQVSYYQQNQNQIQKYLRKKEYNQFKKIKSKYDPDNIFGKKIF